MASRWRREDYHKVRHDICFSDWKVLVSSSDWQASTSGRASEDGAENFRSRNLPAPQAGCGVYELGVTLPTSEDQSDGASLKSEDIVVVYVGHAEHMRKRLQRYSQAGAHLENLRSPVSLPSSSIPELSLANVENSSEEHLWKYSQIDRPPLPPRSNSISGGGRRGSRVDLQASRIPPVFEPVSSPRGGSPRGPRLFSEVFALGCSIAYRWASTRNREVAEHVVQDLTEVFDYAWNRGGSHVRSQDVLGKVMLGKRAPDASSCCTRTSSRWRGAFPFTRKPAVGIRIAAHKPSSFLKPRKTSFFMVLRRSPHLLVLGGKPSKHSAFTKMNIPVERCGAVLNSGLVCSGLPQKGHKRCPTHMIESPPRRFLCFPFRKKAKCKEPKRKGSVSFSTWLTRSFEIKNKSIEWLLAMEEMKGRSYNACSTSPILKPELFSPEALQAFPPNWVPKLSLSSNLNMEESSLPPEHYPKVDHGMPYSIVSKGSPVRWRDQDHYLTPQFFQG